MYKQLILLYAVTLALFGCSSPDADEEARQLAETYKKVQYEIEIKDAEKMADMDQALEEFINQREQQVGEYATEKVLKEYIRNREALYPFQIAIQQKANIDVVITEWNKVQDDKDRDIVTYYYKLEIHLKFWDGSPDQVYPGNGQMDVTRIDGTLKVARDWDGRPNPIFHLWEPSRYEPGTS